MLNKTLFNIHLFLVLLQTLRLNNSQNISNPTNTHTHRKNCHFIKRLKYADSNQLKTNQIIITIITTATARDIEECGDGKTLAANQQKVKS